MDSTVDRTVSVVRNMRDAARRIDLAGFEQGGKDAIHTQLRPLVERLCEVALGFFEQTEGEVTPGASAPAAIDLTAACFAARLELAQAISELRNIPEDADTWDLLDACNRARGSLVKATLAIERTACALAGLPAPPRPRRDVDASIAVRGAYGAFRRAILRAGELREANPHACLATMRDALRQLSASSVYNDLRVADRCSLRRLDDRIEDACARDAAEHLDDEARRLWEEASGVAEMLMRVNDREELREQDAAALSELTQLAEAPGILTDAERARALTLLLRLAGHDVELDALIDVYTLADREPLLRALRAARARAATTPGPVPASR